MSACKQHLFYWLERMIHLQDGQKMPGRATSKDGQLRITHVSVEDSGLYECTASNNVGVDVHDTIEVRVQSNSLFQYFRVKLRI